MLKHYIEEHILRDGRRTALFFAAVAAVFFIDKLTLGPLAAVQLHDIFETDFPRYKPMGELLFKHGLYFWYPNWPGGAPAYAWHHSPMYILNIVAQFVPLWAVYGGLLIALMSAAGYGMYRFLSGYLNVAGWAAVVGGVYFALSMQLSSLFVLYTFSYAFPLYFVWSWDKAWGAKRILKLIILNLFVALSYPVLTLPYFFILEVLLIALLRPEGQNSTLQPLIKTSIVWLGYILVCVPVLYGLYKYVPFSHRHYVYEAVSLAGFLKNLHNGFIVSSLSTMTFIPLAGAAAIMDKSVRVQRSLIVVAAVVILYAVFSSGVNIIFRGSLLEKMDLGHITTVFPIVMTMAAFIAIDTVIKDRVLLKRFVIGAAVGAVYAIFDVCITKSIETRTVELFILNIGSGVFITLIVLTDCDGLRFTFPKLAKNPAALLIFSTAAIAAGFYFGPRRLAVVDYICIAPVLVAAAAGLCTILIYAPRSRVKVMLILALVLLCCLRVTRFFGEESVPYISVFPEISIMDRLRQEQADNPLRPFRIASLDFVYIPMVQNKVFETPDGRGPLFNKYYRQFIGILRAPQLEDFVVRHDFNTNWYNLFISDGFAGFYLYPYAFLNNKYFVITTDKSGSSPNDDFEVVYAGTTADDYTGIWKKLIDLYRRPISVIKCNASFERWYLVKQTSIVKSDEDIADAILKSEGEGLLNTVYYSKADMPQELNGQLTANDKIIATYYSPDEIQLDVEVTSPAALVVSNNYDPRWRASVDGQDTAVLRANLAFQSIEIKTAGRHSVVLRYEDKPQRLTLIFIPVGILIFNFFIIYGGAMTKSHS